RARAARSLAVVARACGGTSGTAPWHRPRTSVPQLDVHEPGVFPIERLVCLRCLIERNLMGRQKLERQLAQQRGRDPAATTDVPPFREMRRDRGHLRAPDLEPASMELPS